MLFIEITKMEIPSEWGIYSFDEVLTFRAHNLKKESSRSSDCIDEVIWRSDGFNIHVIKGPHHILPRTSPCREYYRINEIIDCCYAAIVICRMNDKEFELCANLNSLPAGIDRIYFKVHPLEDTEFQTFFNIIRSIKFVEPQ